MKSDEVSLGHILDEIDFLLKQSDSVSFDQFIKDDVLKRAFARSFEIIGEAVKNLSADFRRRHRHVEWKNIAGFRDRLIHSYFDVNWNVLWNIVKEKVPELKPQIEELLRNAR